MLVKGNIWEFTTAGLVVELDRKEKLATIYKPNSVMGEKIGTFSYQDMTMSEFLKRLNSNI